MCPSTDQNFFHFMRFFEKNIKYIRLVPPFDGLAPPFEWLAPPPMTGPGSALERNAEITAQVRGY